VPSRLPTLASPGAPFGGARSPPPAAGASSEGRSSSRADKKLTASSLACASDLHPGSLGKVLVLRSGRILVRMGGVDFDLSPGLPVDALTTAVLLQPPPPATGPSPSEPVPGNGRFFPAWPPPAAPDNPSRCAIPLGRVTARATLLPCLDSALPEAASGLLRGRRGSGGGGGGGGSSRSPSSSSSDDEDDSGSDSDSDSEGGSGEKRRRRRRRRREKECRPFPRRARDCKLPEQFDREWRQQQEAKAAANEMKVDDDAEHADAAAATAAARTPERASGKKTATAAAGGGGGGSAGKRRVVDSDDGSD